MQMSANAQKLHERRGYKPERSALWDRMSMSQKFSASSLTQFGYELICLRKDINGHIAVLVCGTNVATINVDGDITSSSDIIIRSR